MTAAYDAQFYARQREPSSGSAARMLPPVLDLVQPRSVVDVGCGVGDWLVVAAQKGLDVLGVDGDHVDRRWLRILPDQFVPWDLSQQLVPDGLSRSFDLALSVEVAEHLPSTRAESFIADLCKLAPVVLFSAAVPHQGGREHINEQWPDYWIERFDRLGYALVDCLRPRFWSDPNVAFYYAQNAMLFVAPGELPGEARGARMPIRALHPEILTRRIGPRRTTTQRYSVRSLLREQGRLLRAIPGAVRTTAAAWRYRRVD